MIHAHEPDTRPVDAGPLTAEQHRDACADLRNAEAALRGFCELAAARVISEREALRAVEEALAILADARSRLEPDDRARAEGRRRRPRLIAALPTP